LVDAINCGQVYRYITKPWHNEELQLTVKRALEHYETNKSRWELELANQRLSARLMEIQMLATLSDNEEMTWLVSDDAVPVLV